MPRLVTLVLAALLPLTAAAEVPAPLAGQAACHHYENRARFKARAGVIEFETVLAEACVAARAAQAAAQTPPAQRAAAADYLARLGEARAAIADINDQRLAVGPDVSAGVYRRRDLRSSFRLVNPAGEFLILRSAGVFAALDAWVAAGAEVELAAALP